MSRSTYFTRWGADSVTVCADWAQASCPVEGVDGGRQVADFRHDWRLALRAALHECAAADGLIDADADALVEAAMARAKEVAS